MGLTGVNTAPPNTTRKMSTAFQSTMAALASLMTELIISTATPTRIPAKAFLTAGSSETLPSTAAMAMMMTREGNTSPSVAITPPSTPAIL